ncbi:MAG: ACP S-malonyltransferase [Spirochaetia bacterium]
MSGETKKKAAVLFPGQGAQYVGMAKDLFDQYQCVKDLFQKTSQIIGMDSQKLLFESDDETLRKTENTQVAITLANLSAFFALKEEGLGSQQMAAVAGFSLGEYSALVASEVISAETCMSLVHQRGQIMQAQGEKIIAERGEVGMAAVVGLSPESVESVLKIVGRDDVFCANYNSPTQMVISGMAEGIDAVEASLKEAGARRVLRLKVSGPFHTPLLEPAGEAFSALLSSCNFQTPTCALFSNVSGDVVKSGEQAKELLSKQIFHPVAWISIEEKIKSLLAEDYLVIESGPGSVLCGLWKGMGFDQAYPAGKHEEIIQACSLL